MPPQTKEHTPLQRLWKFSKSAETKRMSYVTQMLFVQSVLEKPSEYRNHLLICGWIIVNEKMMEVQENGKEIKHKNRSGRR